MTGDLGVIIVVVLLILYAMVDVGFTWREMKMEKMISDRRKEMEEFMRGFQAGMQAEEKETKE